MRGKKETARLSRILDFVTCHKIWTAVIIGLVGIVIAITITFILIATQKKELSENPAVAEYQRQLPDLRKEAENKPDNADAQKNYAIALYASGDAQAAQHQYEKVIKLSPDDATSYNNLANAYRDSGKYDQAVKSYKEAIRLNSQQSNSYINLANVQFYQQSDSSAAIATYKQGLGALPKNSDIEYLLGSTYERIGNKDLARQTYRNILSYEPSNRLIKAALERLGE